MEILIQLFIGLIKEGYPVNIFLISPRKHMLWVLIRSASLVGGTTLLMSTHNICFRGEIRKISILLDRTLTSDMGMQEKLLFKVLFFFQSKSIDIFLISQKKNKKQTNKHMLY